MTRLGAKAERELIEEIARSGASATPPGYWERQVRRRVRQGESGKPSRKPSSVRFWKASTALLAVTCVALGGALYQSRVVESDKIEQTRLRQERALREVQRSVASVQREIDEAQAALETAYEQRLAAKTEESRLAAVAAERSAKDAMVRKREELKRLKYMRARQAAREDARAKSKERSAANKCTNSDDPLCGL